jgi:hypothetical protein
MKRIAYLGFAMAVITVLGASTAGAQAQPPSQSTDQSNLADYARKVRKDTPAKSKPKVYDNDNLPKDDKLSVVGTPPAENPASAGPASTGDSASAAGAAAPADKPAGSPENDQAKKQAEWKEWQGKITAQKDSIELLNRELDVLQREYQLRAAAMYADVGNRLRNSAQWDKQDADYKQKVADKQKAVEDAKQKLEDMQEDARKAGVPAAMREP